MAIQIRIKIFKKSLRAGLLYKGITTWGIQTTPFQHHVILRSNEERESAINVFLLPLLSVRQRVRRVRPRSLAAVMLDGERASQPCKHAKSGRGRPPARENGEEGALHNECLL